MTYNNFNYTQDSTVGGIAKAAMFASLFANDLKHMHWHAVGADFDKVHDISEVLYEEASHEADDLAEIAIAAGEKIPNISTATSFVASCEWKIITDEAVDWTSFIEYLAEQGTKYVQTLRSIQDADPIIDDFIHFWEKEVHYKNFARSFNA